MTTPIAITTYPAIVGAFLAAKRKEKGLSQSDLATVVDLTVSTWSRIENGESALTIEQLAQAAEALDLEPSTLLRAVDEKIAELRNRGIVTNMTRASTAAINASGSIPVVGAALIGMVGSPSFIAAAGAIAGYKLYSKLKKDNKP